MKVSKQIRKINGEKPDWIMDDIQDIGYWNGMETAAQIAEDLEKETQLNENQQIVLNVLKEESLGTNPFFTIWHAMENDQLFDNKGMDTKQQFQVLAAFAEWGMKEVAE